MAPAGDDDQLPAAKGAEDGAPPESEEDYVEAVTRHAKYLGIDPESDGAYMWIAEEALNADVPEGWVTGEGEGEYEGLVYYYNEATGESTWDHPLDEYYRDKFKRKKARRAAREKEEKGNRQGSKSRASASKSRASRSTSNRHHRSGGDTENEERNESRSRKGHTKEKQGSPNRVDSGDQGSQSSGHRDNAKRSKTHKDSRRHRDEGERSRHRSTSSRNQRGDDTGDGRDERESSKHLRSANHRHSDSGRAHGSEGEDRGRRRKEESHRRRGSGRQQESSSERHQSRTRDNTSRRSSGRGERERSKPGEVAKKSEKQQESPSKRPGRDKHRSRSRERGARDENRESFKPDRTERGTGSRQEVTMQLEETNRGGMTTVATVSGNLTAAPDDWRTKSIMGESTHSHNENSVHHDSSRSAADPRKENAGSEAGRGGFREDTDREGRHRTAKTTVERTGGVVKELEVQSNSVSVQEDPGKKVDRTAAHRNIDGRSATQTSKAARNNNDMKEIDFEDELRDMEEGGGDPNVRDKSPTETEAPDTEPQRRSSSAVSRGGSDTKNQDGELLSSPPMSKAAAIAVDEKALRSSSSDHANKAGKAKKLGNEDEPHSRRDTTEDRGVKSRGNGLPSATGKADRDLDDWPEVASSPAKEDVGGDFGKEQKGKRYSNAHGTHTVRESRAETGRRGREGDEQPDVAVADAADGNLSYGEDSNNDHWRGNGFTRGYDRNVERTSERESGRLRNGGGRERDRDSGRTSPHVGHTDRNDRQGGHSGRRPTAKGSPASPRRASGSRGGDHSSDQYSSGDRRDHQYSSFGDVEGRRHQRWDVGERVKAGQRDHRDEEIQQMTSEKDKVERQLQQHQQEGAARTRELETKVLKLEASLASSTSREDLLRKELADAARREGVAQEKHARGLSEQERKAESLKDRLTEAISKTSEMSAAGVAGKEKEEGLRLELKNALERAKAAEGSLARKEEAEKASAERESDVPRLRLLLANKESEAEGQGKVLVEMQGRLAEALNKESELSKEVHRARDLAERQRLEAAETSARASTSEAALSQAASEMSALNHALSSRARDEILLKESEIAKAWEETSRLRLQLGLEQEKLSNAEDCQQRAKAKLESEAESFRARAGELQSANASMEREMRNGQQDALSRLRESERERDTAVYEGKRSSELAASAETWRLKETLRADAAEAKALSTGTEVAELRSEAARLRTSMDAVVAPHVKRNMELQQQVEDARREAADLTAETKRLQESHASELSSLKDEVSRKLPWIAEKAVAEAGKHFRQKAEEDMKAVRVDRDRRLEELQALMTEEEARRHDDVAGARVEAERFRTVAERLAAENRSIRGELQQYLTRSETQPALAKSERFRHDDSAPRIATRSPRKTGGGGGGGNGGGPRKSTSGNGWEGVLQAQVLGQVEAHINALRAQLKHETPGPDAITGNGGPDPSGGVGVSLIPSGGSRVPEDSMSTAGATETAGIPPSMETRGNYHQPPPTLRERSGNEDGLTEREDMRLNRLLRSGNSSSLSSPPPTLDDVMAPTSAHRREGPNEQRSIISTPGVRNNGASGGERSARMVGEGGPEHHQHRYATGGAMEGGISDLSRELFAASPTDGTRRISGDKRARRVGEARDNGGYAATPRFGSLAGDVEDDLEDISDGGFHSGCWRRKYVRGEMR
ncbi:unnamed protein product [Ectocarpus fasciculatus]